MHNEASNLAPVASGVRQGSVLDPVLFLIYIKDLPSRLHGNIRLFADYCISYREINHSDNHHIQNSAFSWCQEWQMTLNAEKSVTLTVRKKQISEFTYIINDTPLTCAFQRKYLGVTLTYALRWESHVNKITSSGNQCTC